MFTNGIALLVSLALPAGDKPCLEPGLPESQKNYFFVKSFITTEQVRNLFKIQLGSELDNLLN